jgi:hypothetical protein
MENNKYIHLEDSKVALIKDCADQATQIARSHIYKYGKPYYNLIIRKVKLSNLSRIHRLNIACFPNKSHGTAPDEFGSLLGKELAKRKRVKQLAKKNPYYSDPKPIQKHKFENKPINEEQLTFFNTLPNGSVVIKYNK